MLPEGISEAICVRCNLGEPTAAPLPVMRS